MYNEKSLNINIIRGRRGRAEMFGRCLLIVKISILRTYGGHVSGRSKGFTGSRRGFSSGRFTNKE